MTLIPSRQYHFLLELLYKEGDIVGYDICEQSISIITYDSELRACKRISNLSKELLWPIIKVKLMEIRDALCENTGGCETTPKEHGINIWDIINQGVDALRIRIKALIEGDEVVASRIENYMYFMNIAQTSDPCIDWLELSVELRMMSLHPIRSNNNNENNTLVKKYLMILCGFIDNLTDDTVVHD